MKRARLLLVEDEPSLSKALAPALEAEGYQVDVADNGKAALQYLDSHPFEVVISDLIMRPVDGLAVLRHARQVLPKVVVIVLTGDKDRQSAIEALRCGADDYLLKPCDPAEFFFRVARHLKNREREEARNAAETKNRLLSLAVEQSLDGMAVTDLSSGTFLMVNPAFARMHGMRPRELLGEHFSVCHTPEQMSAVSEAARQFRENGFFEGDVWHARRDGTIFLSHMSSCLACDEKGSRFCVCNFRDITNRKSREQQRLQSERRQQQARKSESLDRMAGAVAHRFNNLLGAVLGNLELALEELSPSSHTVRLVKEALAAANRAAEVSTMMLTYLGQVPGSYHSLELAHIFEQSLPVLQAGLPDNIRLTVDESGVSSNLTVIADPGKMHQVFSSLVINAREAIGDKEGKIRLGLQCRPASALGEGRFFPVDWQPQAETYACLEIADTGCGIAAEAMDSLFDPFFSDKFIGRGLGLPMVLGIVRSYHGAVSVTSHPGQGSVFRVFLPLSAERPAEPGGRVRLSSSPGLPGTVLLIENEGMVLRMARFMLEKLGYEVLAAVNGEQGLAVFETHSEQIACIICDLTMSPMNGWSFLQELRRRRFQTPVIFSSGYDKVQAMSGSHTCHPDGFLRKPYYMKELQDILQKVQNTD